LSLDRTGDDFHENTINLTTAEINVADLQIKVKSLEGQVVKERSLRSMAECDVKQSKKLETIRMRGREFIYICILPQNVFKYKYVDYIIFEQLVTFITYNSLSAPLFFRNSVDPNDQQKLKNILEKLECPVCFDQFAAPVFLCSTGHDICGNCKRSANLENCPVCDSSVTEQRNYSLEHILDTVL
jgi:hypothetical protein